MKYFLIIASLLIVSCTGCLKEDKACTPVPVANEESVITGYATANGISATRHSSGLFFQVINPGTGATPTLSSKVFITYTGKLLNGEQFDQGTNPAATGWRLNELIEGWKLGLPLIKAGGKIKLIIPSALAYGCVGRPGIPANSVLYFDVDLIDVQ